MKAFWLLARLRVLDVLRSRSSASFVLLFPLVLLAVVGVVFHDGHPFERRHLAVVAEGGDESARLGAALASFEELVVEPARTETEALGRLRARMASAVLVHGGQGAAGEAPYRLIVGPRDRLFGRGLAEALPVRAELQVLEVPRGGYVQYLFPGILTFSVMLSGLFATGYTLVLYRQNRFLKKLATTPMPKMTFIGAQIAARSLLVLVQAALLVAAAALFFGVPFGAASLAWLFVITVLGLLTFMGAGFALACVIRTEDLVVDVISAINLPLVLLSEIFFPLDALPRPLAILGGVLPSTEMVRLSRAVLLYGETSSAALAGGLGVLLLWTAATFAVSLWSFKWHG